MSRIFLKHLCLLLLTAMAATSCSLLELPVTEREMRSPPHQH